jgi:hypothetical protein
MQSLFFILSLFALLSLSQAQVFDFTCPKTTCVKDLEICGSVNYTANVPTNADCRSDSVCTATFDSFTQKVTRNGICLPPARLGSPCASQDCEEGTTCRNGYCAVSGLRIQYRNPGEKCSNNEECTFSSPVSFSDNNLCRSGKCRYIKNGGYCTGDNQCEFDKSYCGRSNRCEKLIKKGNACFLDDATSNGCGRRSWCNPNAPGENAGTCTRRYSLKEGQYCTDYGTSDGYTRQCKEGLYCKRQTNADFVVFGVCTKPISTPTLGQLCPLGLCNNDNKETCTCTEKSDVKTCQVLVRPKGYGDADWDKTECGRKKCPNGFVSCLRDKCSKQNCKTYKLDKKMGGFYCGGETYCNSAFSLSSVSLSFVAVFATFVVLMF